MEQVIDTTLHAIWEANRLLRDEGERMAASVGQTHARRMVLQTAGAGTTVPDIARRLRLQRQSVQRVADQLVEEGFAYYQENPHHRRSKLLLTTPAGDDVLTRLAEVHNDWIREIGELASSASWEDMRRGLEELIDALKTKNPEAQNE